MRVNRVIQERRSMHRIHCGFVVFAQPIVVAGILLACLAPGASSGDDIEARPPRAPQGTPFTFAVVESLDAAYLGDTPSHVGRDGGLEFRPNVALGDPVYRTEADSATEPRAVRIGSVTRVVWERVSGSLTVEFDPEPFVRIAVGDEVWVDLNPAPALLRP
jgi:hypothetical protein